MGNELAARATAARSALQAARDDLDQAVAALPEGGTGSAMATPALQDLLLRAVEARRRLDGLETLVAQDLDT